MDSWFTLVFFAIIVVCNCSENRDDSINTYYLSGKIDALELEWKSLQLEFTALGLRYEQLDTKFEHIGSHLAESPSTLESATGAVYTRWGRTTCPTNGTEMVYTGFVAGGHYTHKGAGTQYLCLPADPDSDDSTMVAITGYQNYLYGAEYEMQYATESKSLFGSALQDHDAPCSVCHSLRRATVLMIPGRSSCYNGWNMEYHGYLMSGYYNHESAKEFACMDVAPENLTGGDSNANGALFYPVTTYCGSLPCPPYVTGRAVPCSVCTK